jgi:hypothetical protein
VHLMTGSPTNIQLFTGPCRCSRRSSQCGHSHNPLLHCKHSSGKTSFLCHQLSRARFRHRGQQQKHPAPLAAAAPRVVPRRATEAPFASDF